MATPRETWDLAGALLDGEPVDWTRFDDGGHPGSRSLVGSLRSLSAMTAASSNRGAAGRGRGPARTSGWAVALLVIAALHILIGIVGFSAGKTGSSAVPAAGSVLVVVAFSAVAGWLFAGGRDDRRAGSLGGLYLLVAASFARRFVGITAGTPLNALVIGVFPDAFLPAFLWSFVGRFPRVLRFSAADRFCRAAFRISVAAGMCLFGWNLLLPYVADAPTSFVLHRGHAAGVYWALVLGLCAGALPAILVRARLAPPDERRRVSLFCGVLLAGVAPVVLETLAEILLPGFNESMSRPGVRRIASYGLFLVLLLLPFGTAYAVLVERVLDVRLVVGRALQHLLARGTLTLLTLTPFAVLIAYGARNRALPVGDLFASAAGTAVVSLTGAGLVLLAVRHRALAFVDRVFLRTSVDLAGELTRLTSRLGTARSAAEAFEQVEEAIARATGATFARAYFVDPATDAFAPARGAGQPLPGDSACAVMMRADPAPLHVGSAEPGSLAALLPAGERRWVDDSGCQVLVPLLRGGDPLTGFIGVGPKRNGLGFTSVEFTFLVGISGAAGLALAQHVHERLQTNEPSDDPARECPACGKIVPAAAGTCVCGASPRVAALPAVLNGKFEIDRRVGAGGMGVVYRAVDSALDRPVALKTLSRLSAAAAGQLAGEARLMAAVVHPHLATIFGVERWRGTPVLVVEFCEGGTLADRLRRGPLAVEEALRLGQQLARALEELHTAAVLHRDVKPSNIGFTASGSAKLLDFGIASYASVMPLAASTDGNAPRHTQTVDLGHRHLAGTPLYMSPDVLRGIEPDARLDLWALALVLYEGLAGRHPFEAATVPEVLARVRKARIPDIRQVRPECPELLARALRRWLAREPSDRPHTARILAREIEALIGGGS